MEPFKKHPILKDEHRQKALALLEKMTLEEKIGQLNTRDGYHSDKDDDEIRAGHMGSLFFIAGTETCNQIQKIAREESRLGIPLLLGFDVIHGNRTVFPIPLATAASWDMDRIEECEKIAAVESWARGINWIYAPMVDLCRDPRWGRIAEGAGEDPYLGSCIAAARVRGFQTINPETGYPYTGACFKHFLGYGLSEGGRDYDTTDISERTLYGEYFKPYEAAIEAGAVSTMSSFNCLNGEPVSGSYHYLTEILRDYMGFIGFVCSDYNAIGELQNHRTAGSGKDAAYIGITAGNDMDMTSGVYQANLEKLTKEHPEVLQRIDESVIRILTVKYALGLFDEPYRSKENEEKYVMMPESMEKARDMARNSMVLLKNDNNTLPLKTNKKYLVVGPLSDSKCDMLGTWNTCGEEKYVVTPLEALKARKDIEIEYILGCDHEVYGDEQFDEAVALAKRDDIDEILFFGGESYNWSGENHSKSKMQLPDIQVDLLSRLKKVGKPVVAVLLCGRPVALHDAEPQADAILYGWHSGMQTGNAVCDILFGDFCPCAKLPASIPHYVGQIPICYSQCTSGRPKEQFHRYVDCPDTALYPFGYGLSYADITFSDMKIENPEIKQDGTLYASVVVSNNSDIACDTVVQVYFEDMVSTYATPERRLCAFLKISLAPNSMHDVGFEIPASRFSYFTPKLEEIVEPGDFRLYIGTDSRADMFLPFTVI